MKTTTLAAAVLAAAVLATAVPAIFGPVTQDRCRGAWSATRAVNHPAGAVLRRQGSPAM